MNRKVTALVGVSALVLAACQDMTQQQKDEFAAGAIGAGLGTAAAVAFDASLGWTVVAAAAGAAAGALIARNTSTGECAYADGAGGYTTGPC